MRPRKYPEFNLEYYLSKVCSECGHGEEDVVRYFKKYKSSAYKEAYKLDDYDLRKCLSILLASDINIFTKEYVSLLNHARQCSSKFCSHTANSIYEYYKESFDKVMLNDSK